MEHDEEVRLWRAALDLGSILDRLPGKADSEDDHFYGAWTGGSAANGGHPKGGSSSTDKIRALSAERAAQTRSRQEAVQGLVDRSRAEHPTGIAPPAGTGNPAAVSDFEKTTMARGDNSREYGQVFDKDGNAVTGPLTGTGKQVRLPSNIPPGSTITHSHPTRGNTAASSEMSLSAKDVAVAIDTRAGSIRAFTTSGDWMELRNTGYGYNSAAFQMRMKFAWADAQKALGPDPGSGPDYAAYSKKWFGAYRTTLIETVGHFKGLEIRTGKA